MLLFKASILGLELEGFHEAGGQGGKGVGSTPIPLSPLFGASLK
jgi:hypothetical protein